MSTVVMAAAAAGVLAVGTQDARLLRLGLLAALWAALLGAFAAARMRREARSSAEHADHLRSTYQLELEREVTARRAHALTVERELHERAELTQRSEIVELRAELTAMRANLERLTGGSVLERVTLAAESTRLLPLPAPPRNVDDHCAAAALAATRELTGPERRFGPARHGVPGGAAQSASAHSNGPWPLTHGQRTVDDLLAAHGAAPTPRRRRSHRGRPATPA
ncbi:MAG: DUF6779 domain-containing protein [Pseudonocardiaceae bacterium]